MRRTIERRGRVRPFTPPGDERLPGAVQAHAGNPTTHARETGMALNEMDMETTEESLIVVANLPLRETLVYYARKQARGAIGRVGADNGLREVRAIPAGAFANDWTAIAGLTGNR